MADDFRPIFEGLKRVTDGLVAANQALIGANQGLIAASEGLKAVADAVLAARDEHEDLREAVRRLESLVIEQGEQIRALRNSLDRRRPEP
jgi:hypothetical protein